LSELRQYQEEALQAVRDSVRGGVRRLVLQAPTGSGKTLVAAAIVKGAQAKGNRMVFVVPAISLVDQALEMFYAEGIRDVGVIQANHEMTDWSRPVQIASIQTIRSRGVYPEAKVVVIDECHIIHKEHVKWLGHPDWKSVPFIGLSATPWTRGLGKIYESLLVMSTTQELIDQGYLSKFRVMAADHPDLSKVKTVAGDYHEGQLSGVMQQQGLVANIIETWRKEWGKDKTFLFCVDCAHAKALQQRFHDAGVSCAYQDAKTSSKERLEIKRGFHSGQYRVIASVGTLTTGIDYDCRCLILARPTKSEILFTQIIGRALRTAEGKDHALILDHTDTTSRLGFVTDIHHETLNDGKMAPAARSPRLPKPCPSCQYLIPIGLKVCPNCGFERKIQESKIVEREGELAEVQQFTGSFRRRRDRNPQLFPYTPTEKARFYSQLKGYGILHGYKPGWAKLKYVEKFGDWPDRSWESIAPMNAGPEVKAYITHTILKWVRSKNAQSAPVRAASSTP